MKGKRCVVCDRPANHYENHLAYCRFHDQDALKRQFETWKRQQSGRGRAENRAQ